jgi:hypothetical protein
MPAAARGQVNCSARRRALFRRRRSGRLMIDVTAWAMASGSLSAVAPLSVVRISASAEVRDTTAGVPHASASSAASPKVSCGPGASATSAVARMVATVSRQPIRYLQCVGLQLCEQCGDRSRQHRAIATGERDQPGGQGNTDDARGQLAPSGISPRHHQVDLVSGGAVFRAEAIYRRSKAPRTRAVEVRDLNNPHTLNQIGHVCSVNNATSTGRQTGRELPRPCVCGRHADLKPDFPHCRRSAIRRRLARVRET